MLPLNVYKIGKQKKKLTDVSIIESQKIIMDRFDNRKNCR